MVKGKTEEATKACLKLWMRTDYGERVRPEDSEKDGAVLEHCSMFTANHHWQEVFL